MSFRRGIPPHHPIAIARIEAAIHYGQAAGRKPDGEIGDINVPENQDKQQDRARALGNSQRWESPREP